MVFKSRQTTRYVLIAATVILGLSLLGLLASSFDVEREKLLGELLAVVILLVVLMAAAAITALGLRAFQNRRERSRRRGDEEEDD